MRIASHCQPCADAHQAEQYRSRPMLQAQVYPLAKTAAFRIVAGQTRQDCERFPALLNVNVSGEVE